MTERYVHNYDDNGGGHSVGRVGIIELNTELQQQGTLSDVSAFLSTTVADLKATLNEGELIEITKIFIEGIGWLNPVGLYTFDSETIPTMTNWFNVTFENGIAKYFSLNDLTGVSLTMTNDENNDEAIDYSLDDDIRIIIFYYNKYERR